MMEVFSSKSILPVINPAQDELSLTRSNRRITFCHAETLNKAIRRNADVEQKEGFFHVWMQHRDWAVLADTTDFTAHSLQNRWMLKRKKDRMKEVLGGSDSSVEICQSFELRKDSV